MNLTICNAARSFSCLKVLMLSKLSMLQFQMICVMDMDFECVMSFVCFFLRRDDMVDVQVYKNRVFYVCLDGTK